MLISLNKDDHLARRMNNINKLRLKLSKTNNRIPQELSIISEQKLIAQSGMVRLPEIRSKLIETVQRRSKSRGIHSHRQAIVGHDLMEMIRKQLSLQKQKYFQTISSQQALIVKGNVRPNQQLSINLKQQPYNIRYDQIQQGRQPLMTPPLKMFRLERKIAPNYYFPKSLKKTIQKSIQKWQQEYSPWPHYQSQDQN